MPIHISATLQYSFAFTVPPYIQVTRPAAARIVGSPPSSLVEIAPSNSVTNQHQWCQRGLTLYLPCNHCHGPTLILPLLALGLSHVAHELTPDRFPISQCHHILVVYLPFLQLYLHMPTKCYHEICVAWCPQTNRYPHRPRANRDVVSDLPRPALAGHPTVTPLPSGRAPTNQNQSRTPTKYANIRIICFSESANAYAYAYACHVCM